MTIESEWKGFWGVTALPEVSPDSKNAFFEVIFIDLFDLAIFWAQKLIFTQNLQV